MTFNKNIKDFDFEVQYGDLNHLSADEKVSLGNLKITKISLSGIEDAFNKHASEAESKGVKAHFRVDDSGVLSLEKVESVYEQKGLEGAATGEDESTLSKIGSYFFGSKKEEDIVTDDSTKEEISDKTPEETQEPIMGNDNKEDKAAETADNKSEDEPTDKQKEETTEKTTIDEPLDEKPSEEKPLQDKQSEEKIPED